MARPGDNLSGRPYGTDAFLRTIQAINCLATIIQSLRDADTPFSPTGPLAHALTGRYGTKGRESSGHVRQSPLREEEIVPHGPHRRSG
jgi:hypothetical protein